MAYEEILTANSIINSDVNTTATNTIQSKRITSANASSSEIVLKDGELLVIKTSNRPNLRVGDGSTQIKSLKDVVPGEASTSTAGLMSVSDKKKLDGIATGANKITVDSTLSSTSENPVQNKAINTELGKKLPLSGGTMTGALTTKGIKLTSGTDYGTTLPSSPATNQLFFQTVGSNFVLDNVYPVGSIYMNVNSTNPGTLFGGEWEQIQGKFLLGMSSTYPAGSQGGEATHTITANELPTHEHYLEQNGNTSRMLPSNIATSDPSQEHYTTEITSSDSAYLKPNVTWGGYLTARSLLNTPNGQAHNNMPPYLSIYIWKRTA